MNYQNQYNKLINNAKLENRKKECGFESHHIVPWSISGDNSQSNLVYLTTREHFVAHKLLTKMYTDVNRKKMIYAFWWMCKTRNIYGHIVKSRDYEYARKLYSDNHPNREIVRKEKYKERRLAGLHKKCDEILHSKNMKQMLASMTFIERQERMRKSALSCDQIARAAAIKKGKSSDLEVTYLNETSKIFNSLETQELFGISWEQMRYRIKSCGGKLLTGEIVKYIKKYEGGGKNHGSKNNS